MRRQYPIRTCGVEHANGGGEAVLQAGLREQPVARLGVVFPSLARLRSFIRCLAGRRRGGMEREKQKCENEEEGNNPSSRHLGRVR